MVAISEFSRYTPEVFPCFHSVAIRFRIVRNSRPLLAKSHPLRIAKGHSSPRQEVEGTPLASKVWAVSGGVKFDVVGELLF